MSAMLRQLETTTIARPFACAALWRIPTHMNSVYLTTLAGLFGAALGGLSSFSTTWWAQRTKLREDMVKASLAHRRRLYGEFISEASRLYGDALCNERDDISGLVKLYAIIAEMRLLSDGAVTDSAQQVMVTIIDTYLAPNLTLHELHAAAKLGKFDFLRDFSITGSAELARLQR
jgi:hypothetical protein